MGDKTAAAFVFPRSREITYAPACDHLYEYLHNKNKMVLYYLNRKICLKKLFLKLEYSSTIRKSSYISFSILFVTSFLFCFCCEFVYHSRVFCSCCYFLFYFFRVYEDPEIIWYMNHPTPRLWASSMITFCCCSFVSLHFMKSSLIENCITSSRTLAKESELLKRKK